MKPSPDFPDIAFIMPPLGSMLPSGVTTFVRQMSEGFGKYGDRFRVVEIPHGEQLEVRSQKSEVSRSTEGLKSASDRCQKGTKVIGSRSDFFPLLMSYGRQLGRDVRRVWKVRRQIGRRVIVSNQFGCETLPVALRLVFPFSKIVTISHTHPGQDRMAAHPVRCLTEHLCYWSVSDILYNSGSSRHEWARKLGIPESKGRVIHLGTEPPDLTVPSDYPVREPGMVDFICVARFVEWKGQGSLIRVWQEVLGKGELRARLILIGDGPCFDATRRDADVAGLGSKVVFLGARPKADRYFNAADVAVLLSSEPEAFGLTLLEAMSRGKPILASRIGGIPEIVENGESGLLVSPCEYGKVADCVHALIASADERRRLGRNGRKRWESNFTIERMIGRYEAYLIGLDEQG